MVIDGTKLRGKREMSKLSHVDLAAVAGYKSSQRIYQLEKDGGVVNDNIGKALAKALKCSVEEIQA